jgi:4-carboxymuconolactone decarboxylase
MSITDPARTETHALGIDGSDLARTDADHLDAYTNFAFDEVLRHSDLSRTDRLTVQLGAIVAVGGHTEFRTMLGAALTAGLDPVVAKEIVYQAVPYVGMARAIDFVTITNEVLAERGVALPLEPQSTTTPDDRFEVGRATQASIIGGDRLDGMHENATDDTVHFQRFLSANCFGDHYTRGGIDVPRRELLTFAILVGLGGADAQVAGHVAANLHVGNTRKDLLDVLTVLVPYIGYPRTLNGLAAVNAGAPAAS